MDCLLGSKYKNFLITIFNCSSVNRRINEKNSINLGMQISPDKNFITEEEKYAKINNMISNPINVKDSKIQTIRNCFQLEYAGFEYGSIKPGLGDFLRGSCALWEISKALSINFEIYLHNHPIKHFLQLDKNLNINPKSIHHFETSGLYISKDTILLLNYISNKNNLSINISTNIFPVMEPDNEFKSYMKEHLKPNKRFIKKYNKIVSNVEPKSYIILHIRSGDPVGPKKISQKNFEIIQSIIKENISDHDNVYIFSDNPLLKKQLAEISNYKILSIDNICHLSDQSDKNLQGVEGSMIEFFFMSQSKYIYQFSVYRWGSGFSDWCAKIYDIPIKKILLPESVKIES